MQKQDKVNYAVSEKEGGVTGFNDSYEIGGLYRALLFLARDCCSHRFSGMYSLCALNHYILADDTQTDDICICFCICRCSKNLVLKSILDPGCSNQCETLLHALVDLAHKFRPKEANKKYKLKHKKLQTSLPPYLFTILWLADSRASENAVNCS